MEETANLLRGAAALATIDASKPEHQRDLLPFFDVAVRFRIYTYMYVNMHIYISVYVSLHLSLSLYIYI